MPTIKALINKMQTAPNTIRFDEAKRVLESAGYILERQNGSHAHFRNASGDVVTIKKDSTIKAVYVKDVLRRINDGKSQ